MNRENSRRRVTGRTSNAPPRRPGALPERSPVALRAVRGRPTSLSGHLLPCRIRRRPPPVHAGTRRRAYPAKVPPNRSWPSGVPCPTPRRERGTGRRPSPPARRRGGRGTRARGARSAALLGGTDQRHHVPADGERGQGREHEVEEPVDDHRRERRRHRLTHPVEGVGHERLGHPGAAQGKRSAGGRIPRGEGGATLPPLPGAPRAPPSRG